SCQGIPRHCAIIIPPITTNAGAAACAGTTVVNGVNSNVTANNPPVTTLASPVRAPSPTPAADSRNTVLGDDPVSRPSRAPAPPTTRIRPNPGTLPSRTRPASAETDVMVPMASKKPDSTKVNRNTVAATGPAVTNPPNNDTCPNNPRSGALNTCPGR